MAKLPGVGTSQNGSKDLLGRFGRDKGRKLIFKGNKTIGYTSKKHRCEHRHHSLIKTCFLKTEGLKVYVCMEVM